MENGEANLLWDMNIQCDNVVQARRPDVVVVSKKEIVGCIKWNLKKSKNIRI